MCYAEISGDPAGCCRTCQPGADMLVDIWVSDDLRDTNDFA